ncbi:MAG: 3-phosphoshikimate 1-carboxyvinyltransferase [Ruminococcaceae bacterium]|nr:3-phosphoshikimate 1-carboxyvinyltransferase [Oscillospiraceae bacterium]
MIKTIKNGNLSGTVPAIASKSHAHRLLICAALADRPTRIRCTTTNADIDATAACLTSLGADITREGEYFTVTPIREVKKGQTIDCGESGSTMRFLLPVVLALGADASLLGHGRLPSRPLSPLYEELISHGAILAPQGTNPLGCRGCLTSGDYTIDGGVSSQFISGLMFALPLLGEKSRIIITGKAESRPYIDLTLSALRTFGVDIRETEPNTFSIFPSVYTSPHEICTEGDWSNAAFWLTAGAFSEAGITVTTLDPDSIQGDRRITAILADLGAHVTFHNDAVTVKRAVPLHGITVDASDIPDLVPILSVAAAGAIGKTAITGCGRLRLKESDRIETVCAMIRSLGGKISSEGDTIIITGKGTLTGGTADSANDHRIAMAASIAAGICTAPVTVTGAEAVAKSYPDFYSDLIKLNGEVL